MDPVYLSTVQYIYISISHTQNNGNGTIAVEFECEERYP